MAQNTNLAALQAEQAQAPKFGQQLLQLSIQVVLEISRYPGYPLEDTSNDKARVNPFERLLALDRS